MKKLDFDSGVREYGLGNALVRFNPTDIYFNERLSNAFDKLEGLQFKFQTQIQADIQDKDAWEVCRNTDREMRKVIDNLFGKNGIANEIFEDVALYAFGENSLPIWVNALVPVAAEVHGTFGEIGKEDNPKLVEYLKKYNVIFDEGK